MCKKTIAKKTIEAKKNYLKNKSGTIARTKARWCREREHRAIVIERRGATSNAMECMCQSQSLLDSRPINPLVYDPIWIFYWHLFELNVDISRRSSSPMTINAVFLWYEAFFLLLLLLLLSFWERHSPEYSESLSQDHKWNLRHVCNWWNFIMFLHFYCIQKNDIISLCTISPRNSFWNLQQMWFVFLQNNVPGFHWPKC